LRPEPVKMTDLFLTTLEVGIYPEGGALELSFRG